MKRDMHQGENRLTPREQQPDAADDVKRLRAVYADRASRVEMLSARERPHPGELHMAQSFERQLMSVLRRHGLLPLSGREILDVGCGTGGLLLQLLLNGADPAKMHGIDLLEDRVARAQWLFPAADLRCADAQRLPYPDGGFDVVIQSTVFTSILDMSVKQRIAREMTRVLRKPGGIIVWYDFWLNPGSTETKGIRFPELRSLFPGCSWDIRAITLAPPIVRRLARYSWLACDALESLRLLNTHYLAAIRPEHQGAAGH